MIDFVLFQLFKSGLFPFLDSIFFSRLHIIKGELGGNGYTLGFKHQRTSVFFTLKSYLTNVFNMDFTKIQVQRYIKPSPEKGKILKQTFFSLL